VPPGVNIKKPEKYVLKMRSGFSSNQNLFIKKNITMKKFYL